MRLFPAWAGSGAAARLLLLWAVALVAAGAVCLVPHKEASALVAATSGAASKRSHEKDRHGDGLHSFSFFNSFSTKLQAVKMPTMARANSSKCAGFCESNMGPPIFTAPSPAPEVYNQNARSQ